MDKSLIIVVTYNSADYIDQCLRSIYAQEHKDFFVLVIDNHSSDDTVAKIKEFKNSCSGLDSTNYKLIALKKNIGFSRAIHYGVFQVLAADMKDRKAEFSTLVLINPDLCLYDGALSALIQTFAIAGQDCGASGGLIMDYDCDAVTHCGAAVQPNYITSHLTQDQMAKTCKKDQDQLIASDYVTGALFACKLDLFRKLGGFDPGYRPAYFEELDFCLKLQKIKMRSYVNPKSRARHFECGSVQKFSPAFYYYYHKNRIRCALIHSSPFHFLKSFIPAEVDWLKNQASKDQFRPLLKAYLINLFFIKLTLFVKLRNYFLLKKMFQ